MLKIAPEPPSVERREPVVIAEPTLWDPEDDTDPVAWTEDFFWFPRAWYEDPANRARIAELRAEGLDWTDIGRALGCDPVKARAAMGGIPKPDLCPAETGPK